MALVINTNVAAINGAKNLNKTQDAQAQVFNRLSTGLRLNSAKDDAGGLYLAQAQTKDVRGLAVATRNAGDAISMTQTAEGALDQIQNNLQRMNELAVQSANGTYNADARGGLDKEFAELKSEINRIIDATEFNGHKLLNGSAGTVEFQIGFDNASPHQIELAFSDIKNGTALSGALGKNVAGSNGNAAKSAITAVRNAIDFISEKRADFGAKMNRFETVIAGNDTYSENLQAARSRIQDADFAQETANLAKLQVLQQAGISALGQANSAPQSVLGLL